MIVNLKKPNISEDFNPPYLDLHRSGELLKRGKELWSMMASCKLCPRLCRVNRLNGEKGVCRATSVLEVASCHPHHGEERPLVGTHGSGTIFFSHCSLRCVFCINCEISHSGEGKEMTIDELAQQMLKVQNMGCHNLNLVSPTHYVPFIILALDQAIAEGFRLPIVYNTSGWERVDILMLLDGIVDIYLTDFKFFDSRMAGQYANDAQTYPELTKRALLEMQRQVGVAKPASDGLMYRGLMIRHLVMPENVSGSIGVMNWISEHLPKNSYINIMSQYSPYCFARDYPEIDRPITREEYKTVVKRAIELGLNNLDIQGAHLML